MSEDAWSKDLDEMLKKNHIAELNKEIAELESQLEKAESYLEYCADEDHLNHGDIHKHAQEYFNTNG
jgi:hypothetical protein